MGFGWVKRVDPYPYLGLFPSTQPGWSTCGNPYLRKVCPISMQSFLPHRLRFYLLMKGYGPRCHLNHSRLVQDTTKNTTVNNNVWNTITHHTLQRTEVQQGQSTRVEHLLNNDWSQTLQPPIPRLHNLLFQLPVLPVGVTNAQYIFFVS